MNYLVINVITTINKIEKGKQKKKESKHKVGQIPVDIRVSVYVCMYV